MNDRQTNYLNECMDRDFYLLEFNIIPNKDLSIETSAFILLHWAYIKIYKL